MSPQPYRSRAEADAHHRGNPHLHVYLRTLHVFLAHTTHTKLGQRVRNLVTQLPWQGTLVAEETKAIEYNCRAACRRNFIPNNKMISGQQLPREFWLKLVQVP